MENLRVYKLDKDNWKDLGELFTENEGAVFTVDLKPIITPKGTKLYKCLLGTENSFYITQKMYDQLVDVNVITRVK